MNTRPTGLYDPSNSKHLADSCTCIRIPEKGLPRIFGLNFILCIPTLLQDLQEIKTSYFDHILTGYLSPRVIVSVVLQITASYWVEVTDVHEILFRKNLQNPPEKNGENNLLNYRKNNWIVIKYFLNYGNIYWTVKNNFLREHSLFKSTPWQNGGGSSKISTRKRGVFGNFRGPPQFCQGATLKIMNVP